MKLLSPSAREFIKLPEAERRAKWNALSPDEQLSIRVETERIRRAMEYPTPGDLAMALDPTTVQTPALQLVDSKLVKVGQAIEVMYARRRRLQELLVSGVDENYAVEQVTEEVPSRGITRLIVSLPFQEGKSTRAGRYGLEWFLRQYPSLRITLTSYDGINANRISYQIRSDIELFDGTNENADLGLRLMPDQKAMGRFMLRTGGGVYAIGIGGGLTGHPSDLGYIDDPIKDIQAAESILRSNQQEEWYQTTFRPRLAPWAPVMIFTTRWADNDLVGRLTMKRDEDRAAGMKNFDDWEVINIPAQADHDPRKGETDVLGRQPGEYMMSARGRSREDWETTKNATPARYWQCMYQGNPTPGTGSIFLTKWWRRYDTVLWTRKEGGAFDVPGYELTQSWDMTFKDTKGTDYVVGGVIAKKGADSFLIYVMRARLDFTSTIQEFERMCRLFPKSRAKYIEEKANGAAVINVLKKKIPGLIAINPTESKTSRAEAASVYVRSGNIWLPTKEIAAETPELAWDVEGFINEHTAFDKGTHDDQVDMLSQYINEKYIIGGTARVSSPVGTGPKPRVTPPAEESELARRIRENRSA